jgi:GMP synthase (glutamine-hydrolysing) A subunit
MLPPRRDLVLILDFGSQYTQLIARRVRELAVYSEIHPFSMPLDEIRRRAPIAIILSGGPMSCYEPGAPSVSPELFSLGIPILGICYGAQLVVKLLGGKVAAADKREYGRAHVTVQAATDLFHGFKAAAPLILAAGGGAIVSTASISGTRPAAGEAPYAASKAAVAALTATAALEYAPTVRVNAVSPGMIRTPLTELLLDDRGIGLEAHQRAKTPLDRIGTPEDIADVVVFLCSDLARFITGQNLVVDGGMTLHGSGVDGVLDVVHALMSQR